MNLQSIKLDRVFKKNGKFILPIILIFYVVSKIPILFQELPPFTFCDEDLFSMETYRLLKEDGYVLKQLRSGSINVLPTLIISKIISHFIQVDFTQIILIGRSFNLIILGIFGLVGLHLLTLQITKNYLASIICIFLFLISPYTYSTSRYWYPDHFIFFSIVWSLFFIIKFIYESKLNNLIISSIFFSIALSIKYTAIILIFPIICILFFNKENKFFVRNLLIFSISSVLLFLLINYSLFYDINLFLNDFNYNIKNYGSRSLYDLSGINYYLFISLILPLGFSGLIMFIYGIIFLINSNRIFLTSFFIYFIFFLLLLGTVPLVINRNISILIPFLFPIFASGIIFILSKYNFYYTILKIIITLSLIFNILLYFYSINKDFKPDSRIIARNWINQNIKKGTEIGINEGCSGEPAPDPKNYKLTFDPDFINQHEYYVFNSYWGHGPGHNYLGTKGVLQQIEQKYIHFYNYGDKKLIRLNPDMNDDSYYINKISGYKLIKKFDSNGPVILLYIKQ
jgi:hypothetical protein